MIKFLNFRIEKSDTIKTGRFLLYFVFFYLAASAIFNFLFALQAAEEFVAGVTLSLLELNGFHGNIVAQEPVLIQLSNNVNIVISELCTGLMEMFIIVSAILASHGIEWKKRILGGIASVIVLQFFNFSRIFLTAIIILGNSSIETIEFTHNVLFRAFLFIAVAGTYIAWFYLSTKK